MSLARRCPSPCTRGMAKSESAAQEWTLASIPVGEVVDVREVPAEDGDALLVHGIRPGARLSVDGDAPFGGPRIVRLRGCRVAIDRRLTRAVLVSRVGHTAPDAGIPGR